MPLPRLTDRRIVETIDEIAGDGYAPMPELLAALPWRSHAERRRAVKRAINRGFVLERRGPDRRLHIAIAAEGWRMLRG